MDSITIQFVVDAPSYAVAGDIKTISAGLANDFIAAGIAVSLELTPPLQGPLSALPVLGIGNLYFANDVNILYIGTASGNSPTTALPLAGPAADIPEDSPAGLLYFATDTNVLYVALGQGNIRVSPVLATGTLSKLPMALNIGTFYLATDVNSLYIGTPTGNLEVGPSLPDDIDMGTF